ncbi:MAG TPA: hypothetical protein VN840_18085, partial [Streptosporangiaceae bacterium]|nr:hypothetical protein [Streptosporangiaceae bacterium]
AAAREAAARGAETRGAGARGAGARGAGARESEIRDGGARDAAVRGAGGRDAGAREAQTRDAGAREAAAREAGTRDAGTRDAGTRDAGAQGAAAHGDPANRPGPLTQAASAARVEAEARIRAALRERRSWAPAENPYADLEPDSGERSLIVDTAAFDALDAAVGRDGRPRPEAASGAYAWPAGTSELELGQQPEPGPGWADQDPGATAEIRRPAAVAFLPRPELAAYLDDGPETDPYFDGQEDSSAAGFTKWSRMTRGHAMPRLPRARRPGAAPGA